MLGSLPSSSPLSNLPQHSSVWLDACLQCWNFEHTLGPCSVCLQCGVVLIFWWCGEYWGPAARTNWGLVMGRRWRGGAGEDKYERQIWINLVLCLCVSICINMYFTRICFSFVFVYNLREDWGKRCSWYGEEQGPGALRGHKWWKSRALLHSTS